jgi:hypothetical protein
VRRAPEPGPVQGDRDELYDLFLTRPRRPSAGRRVRSPQPPSIGSRIADSSLIGGARSHSLGTEGAEALPRWDPPG